MAEPNKASRGYLSTKEIRRLMSLKQNVSVKSGSWTGTDKEKAEFESLKRRWELQQRNASKHKERVAEKGKKESEEKEKQLDPLSGTKRTGYTAERYKGEPSASKGGRGFDLNTGGGQPISKGNTWPDEPSKERVSQPRSSASGQFTYNSIAGLDKKDKRDRAKGTGDFGEDPAITEEGSGVGTIYESQKSGGKGFKKGDTYILKNGKTVVFTHDISLEKFYKYFMTNYKDNKGEFRNALMENGLLMEIGQKYQKSIAGQNADESGYVGQYEENTLSAKRQKAFEEHSAQWSKFVGQYGGDSQLASREALAKNFGNFMVRHPNQPNAATNPGFISKARQAYMARQSGTQPTPPSPTPTPKPTPTPTPAPAPSISRFKASDEDAKQFASSRKNAFMTNNYPILKKYADESNLTVDDLADMVASGDLKMSDLQ